MTDERKCPAVLAFGTSLPEWIQQWAINQFGPIRNGPGGPAPTYVMGIFLSIAFVAGATVVVRRRQVK